VTAGTLIYGLAVVLLLYVSCVDLASVRIPNLAAAAIAACFIPFAVAVQMPFYAFLLHVGVGLAVLAVGFVLFSIGLRFGAGDAKLFAALSLWCGLDKLLPFFVVMCFVGGALGIIVFMLRQFGIPVWLAAHGWHIPPLDIDKSKAFVPYAPAMAFAFIYVSYLGVSF